MNPATSPFPPIQPTYLVNAEFCNGIAPGFAPVNTAGLFLNIGPGTAIQRGQFVDQPKSQLVLIDNTVNNVYLDAANNCVPTLNNTTFPANCIPIAQVTCTGGVVVSLLDLRSEFVAPSLGPGGVKVLTNSYSPTVFDAGLLFYFNSAPASGDFLQLAAPSSSGFSCFVQNGISGTATVTITTSGSLIDGATSLVLNPLQGVYIATDGINYYTERGMGSVSASGATASGAVSASGALAIGFGCTWNGLFPNSMVLLRLPMTLNIQFGINFAGSQGFLETVPTGTTTFSIQKAPAGSGTFAQIGTMQFAAGARTATFTLASVTPCGPGDTIRVVAPASSDVTAADIGFILQATKV